MMQRASALEWKTLRNADDNSTGEWRKNRRGEWKVLTDRYPCDLQHLQLVPAATQLRRSKENLLAVSRQLNANLDQILCENKIRGVNEFSCSRSDFVRPYLQLVCPQETLQRTSLVRAATTERLS